MLHSETFQAKIYNKENDVATTKHVRHTREEPSDTNYNQYLDDLTYEYLETEDDDYSKVKSGEVDDLEENLKNEAWILTSPFLLLFYLWLIE